MKLGEFFRFRYILVKYVFFFSEEKKKFFYLQPFAHKTQLTVEIFLLPAARRLGGFRKTSSEFSKIPLIHFIAMVRVPENNISTYFNTQNLTRGMSQTYNVFADIFAIFDDNFSKWKKHSTPKELSNPELKPNPPVLL